MGDDIDLAGEFPDSTNYIKPTIHNHYAAASPLEVSAEALAAALARLRSKRWR